MSEDGDKSDNVPAVRHLRLVYSGTPIGERSDFLCLTDMWRAAGSDASKRPTEWLRQTATIEFISYLNDQFNVGNSHIELVQSVRGGADPGTWAHWQLAMAYAKYLTPEFHAWCNQVVRAHMERRGLPVQAVQGAITLSDIDLERFAQKIGEGAVTAAQRFISQSVEPRFNCLEVKVDKGFETVERRLSAIENSKKGRPLKSALVALNRANFYLGGLCPCCGLKRVCNDDGSRAEGTHYDHFTQVDKKNAENGWIVCSACNLGRLRTSRHLCRPAFDSFQIKMAELLELEKVPLLARLN